MSALRFSLMALLAFGIYACNSETSSIAAEDSVVSAQEMTVYKTPQCGCCGDWVTHMRNNGFQVNVIEQDDLSSVKNRLGVPQNLRSCHTGVIGQHVIEGHVPAAVVRRFLADDKGAGGLSVPGMPVGSPGMEMGDRFQAYSVMHFDDQGNTEEYMRIGSAADQQ